MTIIDIDSHFYEPFEWLSDTDPELAAELPTVDKVTLVVTTAFGEVMSTLPPQYRPDPFARLPKEIRDENGGIKPEALAGAEANMENMINSVHGGYRPEDRLDFMDQQGIDIQFVLPTFAFNPIAYIRREKPELANRLLTAYNTWACGQLAGHTDRLMPVTIVDLKSMDRATTEAELERSRAAGARSVLFWPSPVEGKSIGHPDFDWFWATCERLGIMPMVHVGASRPGMDTAWLNNGREHPLALMPYMSQLHQIPEILIAELLAAGTFERYPNLRLLVCELGIDWLPSFVRRMDGLAKANKRTPGGWPYPMMPSEYLRRNLRVSPLAHDPASLVIEQVGPGMIVFSTDYPHLEGGKDAVSVFQRKLDGRVDEETTAAFFGGTIAADMALSA